MKDLDAAYILFFIGMMIVGFILSIPHIIEERKLKRGRLKCKLLRKIHNQFKIVYVVQESEGIKYPTYKVISNTHPTFSYFVNDITTDEEALQKCKDLILTLIRDDYKRTRPKPPRKHREIKVWHN